MAIPTELLVPKEVMEKELLTENGKKAKTCQANVRTLE